MGPGGLKLGAGALGAALRNGCGASVPGSGQVRSVHVTRGWGLVDYVPIGAGPILFGYRGGIWQIWVPTPSHTQTVYTQYLLGKEPTVFPTTWTGLSGLCPWPWEGGWIGGSRNGRGRVGQSGAMGCEKMSFSHLLQVGWLSARQSQTWTFPNPKLTGGGVCSMFSWISSPLLNHRLSL